MKRITASPARLPQLNMAEKISRKDYDKIWHDLKKQFNRAVGDALTGGQAIIILIEGWDAGGKSGVINRLAQDLPGSHCTVKHIIAPTEEEKAHHHLWRFKTILPEPGNILIMDRSWYGRVLVERVEGLTAPKFWQRGFDEINSFEQEIQDRNIRLIKFWLQVSGPEQGRRIAKRITTPAKNYKLSERDVVNFLKRDDYEAAAEDMFDLTDSNVAPWHLVPADDKKFARVRVMESLIAWLGH